VCLPSPNEDRDIADALAASISGGFFVRRSSCVCTLVWYLSDVPFCQEDHDLAVALSESAEGSVLAFIRNQPSFCFTWALCLVVSCDAHADVTSAHESSEVDVELEAALSASMVGNQSSSVEVSGAFVVQCNSARTPTSCTATSSPAMTPPRSGKYPRSVMSQRAMHIALGFERRDVCDLSGKVSPVTVCSAEKVSPKPTEGKGSRGSYKLYPDGRQYSYGYKSSSPAAKNPKQWRISLVDANSPPLLLETACDFQTKIDPYFKYRRCQWKNDSGQQCPGRLLSYPDISDPTAYSTEFISRSGERFCGVGPTSHMEGSSAGYGVNPTDELWYDRPHFDSCPKDPEEVAAFRNRLILKQEADMGIPTREMVWGQSRRVASSDLEDSPTPWRGVNRHVIQRERVRATKARSWNDPAGKPMRKQLESLPDFLLLIEPEQEEQVLASQDAPTAPAPTVPAANVRASTRRTLFVDRAHDRSGDATLDDDQRVSMDDEEAGAVRFAACLVNRALESEIRSGKFKYMAVDGSFCCNNKYQLVTIWGKRSVSDTVQVPLFTILMEGKRREDYDRVFQRLSALFPNARPLAFSADFERALWESFSSHFGSRFAGCLYHFLSNMDKQMSLKNVPVGWRAYIRSSIAEVAMSATTGMRDAGLARLLSDLGAGPTVPGHLEIKGAAAFGRYFAKHYVGVLGREAVLAGPDFWAVAGRSAEEILWIQVTNNMAELANKKTKAYMASKGTKQCSTPKYMHYLSDAFLEMFTIPALYSGAVDSRGRSRIPIRKTRKSEDSLGASAARTAGALEEAGCLPPPAPLLPKSQRPRVGVVDAEQPGSLPSARSRRPPGKLTYDVRQHAHNTLGTGGSKRKAGSNAGAQTNHQVTKRQRTASTTSISVGNPACDARGSSEPTLFSHLARMIVAHPNSDISLVGFGLPPGNLPAQGGESDGNAAVWIMVRGHMVMFKLNVEAVEEELIGQDPGNCAVALHDTEQVSHVRRSTLYLARNGDAEYSNIAEAAEVERTPLSAESLFGYDISTGKLYLAESNQSANLDVVGWSQVRVRGLASCVCEPNPQPELAFALLYGPGAPARELRRGIPICADHDDRLKVASLLALIQHGNHQHPSEILFCLSQVPNFRGVGASAVLG
jgi:hypothetical protein